MKIDNPGTNPLRLAMAPDGRLWEESDHGCLAHDLPLDAYAAGMDRRRAVHVLGGRDAASLIRAIYDVHGERENIKVATPAICKTPEERKRPEIVFGRMRQCLRPPSVGGWATIQEPLYTACRMAEAFDAGTPEGATVLLSSHPAAAALSFIGVRLQDAARLLSHVLDPRWFVHPEQPNRVSRLRAYMGLHPRIFYQLLQRNPQTPVEERCRLAMRAWVAPVLTRADDAMYVVDPKAFLFRKYTARRLRGMSMGEAGLRTTQSFIAYLFHSWLQAIYPTRGGEPLFDSQLYFKDEGAVAAAYDQHVKYPGARAATDQGVSEGDATRAVQ